MKIILTGASGFLGRHLLEKLDDGKNNCSLLDNSDTNYRTDLSTVIPDISAADMIIHAAGKVGWRAKSESDFFNTNVIGTINLLKAAEKVELPKRLIYISSVSVYGLNSGELITEETELKAQDPYGISKIHAEEIIQDWCYLNGVICTIFRLPLLIGVNPSGNLQSMIRAIQKGYYFNIFGGRAKRSMVLAADIADAINKASELGGIYNLTDGYHPSFNELSQVIAKQYGKKYLPQIPFFIAQCLATIGDCFGDSFPVNSDKLMRINTTLTFDDSKARNRFGWNPTPVLHKFKIV